MPIGVLTKITAHCFCIKHYFLIMYNFISGNFCPICHKCYSDDDWDCKMVQCAKCDSWVHAMCEGLSGMCHI